MAGDAQFSEICEAHKITFIDSSVENLMTMRDKVEARETMPKASLQLGIRNTRQGIRRSRKKVLSRTMKMRLHWQRKLVIPWV